MSRVRRSALAEGATEANGRSRSRCGPCCGAPILVVVVEDGSGLALQEKGSGSAKPCSLPPNIRPPHLEHVSQAQEARAEDCAELL